MCSISTLGRANTLFFCPHRGYTQVIMEMTAPFVLLDDARSQTGLRLYTDPVRVLSCTDPGDAQETLAHIDQAIDQGFHVAGYLAYELGYLLEPKLQSLCPQNLAEPLIWMGVFKPPQILNAAEAEALMAGWAQDGYDVGEMTPAVPRAAYLADIETIRDHIRAGDVYQINATFKQNFDFSGSPLALYATLRRRQRAAFGAVIHTGDRHILSLSPELFVQVQDGTVRTRPMKGTAARAASPAQDFARRRWLRRDEKSRAENLMIVDLLRNDLGRIATVGTVEVSDLFTVETYPTLHQMTSGIQAELRPGTKFSTVLEALFPCGSVTGAPKVKAMEIIHALETKPRGVYTGAIGCASNTEGMRFNVAIRTLSLDLQGHGEMGIGSGIVYDSIATDEWDECHLKADFISKPLPSFQLLETLKWEPESGFIRLSLHLDRLAESAAYFCFSYDQEAVEAALNVAISGHTKAQRVRLTLDDQGRTEVTIQPLWRSKTAAMTYALSDCTVATDSPFTYHKTTHRAFYDAARERASADEVLFLNAQGELTEGSITNIFIEQDGHLLTPPVACGLLAGTLRRSLLESGRAVEAVLTVQDLAAPNRVYLGNSVRGLVRATTIST